MVSADAVAAMKATVARSKRTASVQFPVEFVRSIGDEPPMLAQLMAGGQGGSVRLKLYLTLAMQATRPPRTVAPRTSAGYARLLDLPEASGSRRVNEALKWLSSRQLIDRTPRPGKPAQITLLQPDGSGEDMDDHRRSAMGNASHPTLGSRMDIRALWPSARCLRRPPRVAWR